MSAGPFALAVTTITLQQTPASDSPVLSNPSYSSPNPQIKTPVHHLDLKEPLSMFNSVVSVCLSRSLVTLSGLLSLFFLFVAIL